MIWVGEVDSDGQEIALGQEFTLLAGVGIERQLCVDAVFVSVAEMQLPDGDKQFEVAYLHVALLRAEIVECGHIVE